MANASTHDLNTPAEQARIDALHSLLILDTLPEQNYDDLTELASYVCGTPVSLISLVDEDRQWFKSARGFGLRETPRSQSFCAHTLPTQQTMVVDDAAQDPRFRDNPLVVGDPNIRFYAGAPILDFAGHTLGTLCVIDTKPRTLDARQIAALEALARQVTVLVEQRRALLAERRTAARLTLAAEAAELGLFSWEAGGRLAWENDRMFAIFGRDRAQAPADAARFASEVLVQAYARPLLDAAAQAFATAGRLTWRGMFHRPDGTKGWVEITGQAERGTPARLLGAVSDITARMETEAALRSTGERTRLAHEAARIASWEWSPLTGELLWNGDTMQIYGRPERELATFDQWLRCVHAEDREACRKGLGPALEGTGDLHFEFRTCWPDGSTHTIVTHGTPVLAAGTSGKPLRIVGVNLNATERRLSEAALRQAEKLAAVGRLASAIAHEMNNPLESVTNLLYLARRADGLPEIVEDYLDTAERELRRVSAIASQTLRFHRQSTNPRPVLAAELFDSVLSLYQGRIVNANIEIQRRERPAAPVVCFDGEIRQVLNNLIGNAIDAMQSSGGCLRLRARAGTHWLTLRRGLLLTVADTGTGMSAEVRRRLFEAFFTTKGISGTGLGLWVSREITERHAGRLRLRTRAEDGPGRGTVFTLFLPYEGPGREIIGSP